MSSPSTEPRSFKITVPDSDIELLKAKLALTRFPDELENSEWKYGAPLADVKRLVSHWKDTYDWRAQEAQLNAELPQFTVDIPVEGFGTLNIHFVHKKSDVSNAVPLLFSHGWPGSFMEVRKILPLLTASSPDHPSFHVVALSLPNFGFSEGVKQKGFQIPQYAEVAHKLMLLLGYDEYVTQGGDWGNLITRQVANMYGPKHAKAYHTNMPVDVWPSMIKHPLVYLQYYLSRDTPIQATGMAVTNDFVKNGRAYHMLHARNPQTLGYSLADSPVGLLAWIYEKLVLWTDEYPWTDDEVLTWISVYWFSRAGPTASTRIYYEVEKSGILNRSMKLSVPLGFSVFPKEILHHPKIIRQTMGNVVFEAEHDRGGHFAAHEKPQELVGDLRKMFGKGGPCFGIVNGKSGY